MPQLPRISRHPAFRLAHLDLAEFQFARQRGGKLVIPRVLERGRSGALLPREVTVDIPDASPDERYALAKKLLGPIWDSAAPFDESLFPHASTAVLFHLLNEAKIVWLEKPKDLPYVRMEIAKTARKDTRFEMTKTGRMLGYAILKNDTPAIDGRYYRRFFRIKEEEPGAFGASSPSEAIKVSSIVAGQIPKPGRD